ncbi:SUMF1/EgtB/PvdO family nonheme iron enzyme [uncultured Arcticibacterium sp.]|uniref:formylglycine-generating enzyme family protein n=1 Tax=uncultured Arcticibacterium sp. TaxID=2173042 RepID=UPI0030F79DC5
MVRIPEGSIELRDDRIKQKWTVKLESFMLSKFLVNQKEYFEMMGKEPSSFKGEELPLENITWKEAILFCNALSAKENLKSCYLVESGNEEIKFDSSADGYRLPTEAEWEYACKAGSDSIRYGDLDKIAWYKNNSGGRTHSIGEKAPNAFGLYDMLGNVWEWCSDIYDETVYGSYRVFRGGGWCDEERSVMATTRRRSHPLKFKIDDLGFRVAKN